jgi:hypothetical protein
MPVPMDQILQHRFCCARKFASTPRRLQIEMTQEVVRHALQFG